MNYNSIQYNSTLQIKREQSLYDIFAIYTSKMIQTKCKLNSASLPGGGGYLLPKNNTRSMSFIKILNDLVIISDNMMQVLNRTTYGLMKSILKIKNTVF